MQPTADQGRRLVSFSSAFRKSRETGVAPSIPQSPPRKRSSSGKPNRCWRRGGAQPMVVSRVHARCPCSAVGCPPGPSMHGIPQSRCRGNMDRVHMQGPTCIMRPVSGWRSMKRDGVRRRRQEHSLRLSLRRLPVGRPMSGLQEGAPDTLLTWPLERRQMALPAGGGAGAGGSGFLTQQRGRGRCCRCF